MASIFRKRGVRRTSGVAAAAGAALATVSGAVPGASFEETAAAQPSPLLVWEHVAYCESSDRWHVNTGNHYYGGLQFWQPTWDHFGGRKYAPRADLATPLQQIEVARRVLAVQGPKAWPVCSKHAKLTKENGRATTAALPAIGPYIHSVPAVRHRTPAKPRVHHYTVRPGDSLVAIAAHFRVHGGWAALWHYNRTNVPNPNVIFVGQVLQIP
jgi:nucleoid-associated protein YgaU